jgi:hypothetical protein
MAFAGEYTPPSGQNAEEFTAWWNANKDKVAAAYRTRADPWRASVTGLREKLKTTQDSWQPMKWEGSQWQTRQNQQRGGMDALAAQISGWDPNSSANMAGANEYTAGLYGMTPEQWSAIQAQNAQRMSDPNFAAQTDASAANAYLETLANSSFMQEQDKAMRVAMRQAEEQIGQQLESVFGERGGMGGFQAAYEMTSQLQSSYLQQKTQQNLGVFNQAVSAVNANNQYFQQLIQQGAISGKDYLQFRFDQLQTGYQNYIVSMDQTMREWQTIEQVDRAQLQQVTSNIESQIDQMTQAMIDEMGGYASEDAYLDAMFTRWSQEAINTTETERETWADRNDQLDTWAQNNVGAMFTPIGLVWGVAKLFTWAASLFE